MKLPRVTVEEALARRRAPVDEATLAQVAPIVDDVRRRGDAAVRFHAEQLGDLDPGAPLVFARDGLEAALASIPADQRELLVRTAARIRAFAQAQRDALRDVTLPIPGGAAGHRFEPLARAGCYAPGGRHPLPSSVLMTTIPARVAGVREVVVASPRPAPITLAAAALGGADLLLAVGGAQAIAALACGTESLARCDVVVGPGNRFVTAAKRLVCADVAIDLLAGPSELLVVADAEADARALAADLLAQAEHDDDARPLLLASDERIVAAVERELELQLADLPTAATARAALANGFALVVADVETTIRLVNELAPEHVELCRRDAADLAPRLVAAGTLFLGRDAAEVFGDYGAGPNHVLPTGGTARTRAGLSVLDFLRARTWLRIDDRRAAAGLARDAAALARLEGLEGHARAAELRLSGDGR
jgi:histidinol dehydrogenase